MWLQKLEGIFYLLFRATKLQIIIDRLQFGKELLDNYLMEKTQNHKIVKNLREDVSTVYVLQTKNSLSDVQPALSVQPKVISAKPDKNCFFYK